MYFKCDAYETKISSFKIFGNKCVIPGSVNPAKKKLEPCPKTQQKM